MAYINRANLLFKDYDWEAKDEGDNPHLRHFPDNVKLARHEGYEVIAFINTMARMYNWSADNYRAGHQVERILRKMPSNITGRKAALEHVKLNFVVNG